MSTFAYAAQQAAAMAREHEMIERGRARAQGILDKKLAAGDAAETEAGIALAKRAIAPLSAAIVKWREEANKGRAGRRNQVAIHLQGIDAELAAYITVRCTLTSAARGYVVNTNGLTIAEALETELMAEAFEEANEPLYRAIVRNAQARGLSLSRQALAVKMGNRKFEVVPQRWTIAERLGIGVKLTDLAIETLDIFTSNIVKTRKKTSHRLSFTAEIGEWFAKFNRAATLMRPLYLPTVAPPKPWEGTDGGAYYGALSRRSSIVTRPHTGQIDALEAATMPAVYAGLNAIQETPWRVNRRVFEVMRECWDRGLPVGCLPTRDDEEVPKAPPEVVNDVKGGEHRKAWRLKVRPIHQRNAANRSRRFEFARTLDIAEENLDQSIYFPHRVDFRGRAYAAATALSPQGPDEARGLLEFAEGKRVGARGAYWLGVHGANLFGNDKISLEERYQWAFENYGRAQEVARDPLGDLWWTEADKPWSFLAWCFEWAAMYDGLGKPGHVTSFVSHLPIALDGSCNGIQHFSAMLRDEVGGAAVNLVPSDKPQDIYAAVAERVLEKLRAEPNPEKQWMASGWLQFGIDRKITKRPVMVLPYGGTFKSCQQYVMDEVRDRIHGGLENPFGDELSKATTYLATLVWSSIGDVVVAARAAMSWLQAVTRVATKCGQPLRWTTPSGFVVAQHYHERSNKRIKTRFMGQIVQFRSFEELDKIERSRQVSAVAPNFVHSLDASAMMLTIMHGKEAGITSWAMIHDSYGTHAADTDLLAHTLRRVFVGMYASHDVLTEFRDAVAATLTPEQAAELPPVPESGTLDLQRVLAAAYFFA